MMTQTKAKQYQMLLTTLDELIPPDHFLRKLDARVDFSFIYEIMRPLYSLAGRPSIDPVVLIKMLLIGYLYGIDSERKLEAEIRYNIAYRWFLGLDIDEPVPDHSTISQNRRRRFHGNEIFRQIFETIVQKCMDAGLVRGENVVMDSTHIKANADNHQYEWVQVTQNIDEYWLELMDNCPQEKRDPENEYKTTVKSKNPHDPEAGYMNRTGKPRGFHYLAHQCADADTGIILDVEVTSGDIQDCECCVKRIAYLKKRFPIKRAAMDKAYDTIPIHHGLRELGVMGYIARCDRGNGMHANDDMMTTDGFRFNADLDEYTCPNQGKLTFRGVFYRKGLPLRAYCAHTRDCKSCAVRTKCYKGKTGYRRINRHIHQHDRESSLARIGSFHYRVMMRKRQIVSEGNFGLQKRCHNLRSTRKRGRENVLEQCLLSAMALNLRRLVWYGKSRPSAAEMMQMGQETSRTIAVLDCFRSLPWQIRTECSRCLVAVTSFVCRWHRGQRYPPAHGEHIH